MDQGDPCHALEHYMPTTVTFSSIPGIPTYFCSHPSLSLFTSPPPVPSPTLWSPNDIPDFLLDAPQYYQRLIGPTNLYVTSKSGVYPNPD
jgi:hypothetical protein